MKKKFNLGKNVNFYLFVLIIILGSFLRLYNLGGKGLWMDEIWSVTRSQVPLLTIFTQKFAYGDASYGFYPIHYFIIHLALIFGKSESIVRLPSVIFGIASIFITYFLGEMLFSKKVGLLAAFFLTISAFHIHYSQEVRYYSYFAFFSLVTLYAFFKSIFAEKKKRWVILFVISTLLNFLLHFVAMLVFLAEILSLPLFFSSKLKGLQKNFLQKKRPILPTAIISFGALFFTLFHASPFIKTSLINKPDKILSNARSLLNMFSGYSISNYNILELSWVNLPVLIFITMFLFGIISSILIKKYTKIIIFFMVWTLTPLSVLLTIAPMSFGFHPRHVIFLLPTVYLIMALGIINLENWMGHFLTKINLKIVKLFQISLLLVIICFYSLIYISLIIVDYQTPKEAWRETSDYLMSQTQKGDMVISDVREGNTSTALKFYFGDNSPDVNLIIARDPIPSGPANPQFRRFYIFHDWVDAKNPPTSIEISDDQIEEIILKRDIYIYKTKPIAFWQEFENAPLTNTGWNVTDSYKREYRGTDTTSSPSAKITFKMTVLQDGNYDLYANLFWNGLRSSLKYQIDDIAWSGGFQPFYGDPGNVFISRWKEVKLGSHFLTKGEHSISFLNLPGPNEETLQTIDYFYLTSGND